METITLTLDIQDMIIDLARQLHLSEMEILSKIGVLRRKSHKRRERPAERIERGIACRITSHARENILCYLQPIRHWSNRLFRP